MLFAGLYFLDYACMFSDLRCILRDKHFGFCTWRLGGRGLKINTIPSIVEDQTPCGCTIIDI
jgi:hypothetical protein